MKNQKLVQEAFKDELTSEYEKQQQIRVRAQLNEYMHYELKKHGIFMKIEEDMVVTFINQKVAQIEETRADSMPLISSLISQTNQTLEEEYVSGDNESLKASSLNSKVFSQRPKVAEAFALADGENNNMMNVPQVSSVVSVGLNEIPHET